MNIKIRKKFLSIFLVISMLFQSIAVTDIFADTTEPVQTLAEVNGNLIKNGGFENTEVPSSSNVLWIDNIRPTDWKDNPWINAGWTTPEFRIKEEDGNKFAQIDANSKSRATIFTDKITVKPSSTYQLKLRLALDKVTGNNFGVQIKQYGSDGLEIDSDKRQVLFVKQGTSDWAYYIGQIPTKENAVSIEVIIMVGATAALAGGTIKIDDVSLKEQKPDDNLILNGGFEDVEAVAEADVLWKSKFKPQDWLAKAWTDSRWGNPEFNIKQEMDNRFLQIDIKENARATMPYKKIEIKPNIDYEFNLRYSLTNIADNYLGVQIKQYDSNNKILSGKDKVILSKNGTIDWTDLSQQFSFENEAKYAEIVIAVGAGNFLKPGGVIQLDNFSLREVIPEAGIPVEKIEMETKIYDIIGTTYKLNTKITPPNATNKTVSWLSADDAIATVDQFGTVTFIKEGNTTIKAITEDGNHEAICDVVVVESLGETPIKNGDFELTIPVSSSDTLWVSELRPQSWIGSVWNGYTAPQYSIEKINNSNALKINIAETNSRGTIVSDKIEIKPKTNYELKWKLMLDSVAGNNFGIQVNQYKEDMSKLDSILIFTKNGTLSLTDLAAQFYSDSKAKYIEIVLVAGPTNALTGGIIQIDDLSLKEFNVAVEKVEVETDIYDKAGTGYQLNSKITPYNSSNQNVVWSSADETIATVDQTGKVTLKAVGTTKIKVTTEDGNKEAVCNVTVVDSINIDEISLQTNIELELEDSIKLVPVVKPEGLILENLVWTSSDSTIATVDTNGLVKAVKEGEVTITVTTPVDYGGKSAESKITIVPKSENLITNGGFEEVDSKDPTKPAGYGTWTPTGKAEQGIDKSQAYRGENSYKIEAKINTRTSISLSNPIVIPAGIYKLSTMVKAEDIVLTDGVRMRYTILKNDGSKVAKFSLGKKMPTDGWEEEFIIFEAPEDTKNVGVEVFFETGTGIAWVDNLKLEKWIPIKELGLPEEETIDLATEREKTLTPILTPADASEKGLIWNTSDEKIVSIDNDGKIKGNKAGKAIITVMTADGSIKAKCTVTVSGELSPIAVTGLTLDKTALELKSGRTEKLNLTVSPIDATDKITWTSSNESVATVIDGRVTGKAIGTATITAEAENGIKATCDVTVTEYVADEFDTLRLSWKNKYSTAKIVNDSISQTQNLWDTMYKNDDTKFLWLDIVNYKVGVNITTTARRLKTMAIAASMEGSKFYGDQELIRDIVEATMWLYENTYSKENLKYYDWFSWEIGIPQAMGDIFSLLYENFTDDEINKMMGFIGDTIMPDPAFSGAAMGESTVRRSTGANLLDQAKGALMPAILLKQTAKINLCKDGILSTLDYVTTEDGFYTDGSFVQHGRVPYTGSYGIVWLGGMADVTEILAGTSYQLETDKLSILIEDSFIDFIYNGAMMDMVRGRAIAKTNNDDHDGGHSAIDSIVRIANSMQGDYKNKFLSLAKYWILNDTCSDNIKQHYSDLINNDSIVAKKPDDKGKEYYNMNRSVYHRNNFAYGISKSSKKIQTFELTNGENQKGWYTGDGMTYLYNDDVNQFDNIFWVTADYYKLPGTTVDTMTRTWGDYQNGDGEGLPANSWAGGTTDGIYGVSGMNLQAIKSDLNLNKSWFAFDDEIVAVGSNINSQSGRDIQTIVEQRKIDGSNLFIVNGEQKSSDLGWSETMTNVKWAYLQGNGSTSPIGYYFPNGETLQATREAKSGDYDTINQGGDKTQYTKNYLTMWKNHGANPQGDTYVYSILPNKTPEQIEAYSENPDTIIVEQTNDVHAVKENNLGIFAANFFSNKQTTADYLTSFNNASVMIKENNGFLELNVSDPTFANQSTIELELEKYGLEVVENLSNMVVTHLTDGVKLSIDVSGENKGQTFTIKFKVTPLEITKVNNPEPLIVDGGITIDKLPLPKNVTVELANAKIVEVPVTWSQTDDSIKYDEKKNGTYIFKGTLETVSGISNSGGYTASIDVIVILPPPEKELEKIIGSARAVLNNPNSTAEEIVEAMSNLADAMLKFENQNN